MCEAVKEYAVNYAKEYAKKYVAEAVQRENIQIAMNLLQNGVSVDLIAQSFPSLSRQLVVELSKQLQQSAD